MNGDDLVTFDGPFSGYVSARPQNPTAAPYADPLGSLYVQGSGTETTAHTAVTYLPGEAPPVHDAVYQGQNLYGPTATIPATPAVAPVVAAGLSWGRVLLVGLALSLLTGSKPRKSQP